MGRLIQEVPTADDKRPLDAPDGVTVSWVVRRDGARVPGAAALDEVLRLTSVSPTGYAFVVGESTLATEGRKHLHRLRLPKGRITFS
ncbi:hypothetical protein FM21_30545 [Streptomyces mutabilis]|uniref:SIP-like Rossmann fold domain-containing protein n=1 Tax=Streptomyces mutabilis TaxID=67332 RepID=A0A086MSP0_9ACTN|nr:hypothetical protein FM21_30545 [Streptomyces mutabilis]